MAACGCHVIAHVARDRGCYLPDSCVGNACRKSRPRRAVVWQVQMEEPGGWHEGLWLNMKPAWNNRLEAAYSTVCIRPWMNQVDLEDFDRGTIDCEVDLKTFVQTSTRSGCERRVRRVTVTDVLQAGDKLHAMLWISWLITTNSRFMLIWINFHFHRVISFVSEAE